MRFLQNLQHFVPILQMFWIVLHSWVEDMLKTIFPNVNQWQSSIYLSIRILLLHPKGPQLSNTIYFSLQWHCTFNKLIKIYAILSYKFFCSSFFSFYKKQDSFTKIFRHILRLACLAAPVRCRSLFFRFIFWIIVKIFELTMLLSILSHLLLLISCI